MSEKNAAVSCTMMQNAPYCTNQPKRLKNWLKSSVKRVCRNKAGANPLNMKNAMPKVNAVMKQGSFVTVRMQIIIAQSHAVMVKEAMNEKGSDSD